MKRATKNLLRISELAERAGVSASTIKHYVNEGLIPKALKTGKNMAYYDASCVERVKLIKKMQKERFLPLDIIKRVIDSGASAEKELKVGKAILKTHRQADEEQSVSEAQISHRTGYPRQKIGLLEKEGLIFPETGDHGTWYDPADVKIIEIMKQREETGLPLDYSVRVVRIYRDAVRKAVEEDIRFFAQNFLGDIPAEQSVRLMTEADDLLESFMVAYRQRTLRRLSEAAIRQANVLPEKLALISFLPVRLREGTPAPEADSYFLVFYHMCRGSYAEALKALETVSLKGTHLTAPSLEILAHLSGGHTAAALERAKRDLPEPSSRMMDNTAAALAYIFAIGESTGFSQPIYLAKKAIAYLKKNDAVRETDPVIRLFSQYATGAAFTILPDVFDVFNDGMKMLEEVRLLLEQGTLRKGPVPEWLDDALEHEIFPAMRLRADRFLAEGCIKQGNSAGARESLHRIVILDSPSGTHSAWARMKLLEIE